MHPNPMANNAMLNPSPSLSSPMSSIMIGDVMALKIFPNIETKKVHTTWPANVPPKMVKRNAATADKRQLAA